MTERHGSTAAKIAWQRLQNHPGSGTAGAKTSVLYNAIGAGQQDVRHFPLSDPDDGNLRFLFGTYQIAGPHFAAPLYIQDFLDEKEDLAAAIEMYLSGEVGSTKGLLTTKLPKLPKRQRLKSQIHALLEIASIPNWDGEGAVSLSITTVRTAQKLADSFPAYVSDPEVDVTPHGEVDFDWIVSRDTMLTISVGPSGEIAFAGRFQGGSRIDGVLPKRENLSSFLSACFEELNRHSD